MFTSTALKQTQAVLLVLASHTCPPLENPVQACPSIEANLARFQRRGPVVGKVEDEPVTHQIGTLDLHRKSIQ